MYMGAGSKGVKRIREVRAGVIVPLCVVISDETNTLSGGCGVGAKDRRSGTSQGSRH